VQLLEDAVKAGHRPRGTPMQDGDDSAHRD
jgi:hypothetical protein